MSVFIPRPGSGVLAPQGLMGSYEAGNNSARFFDWDNANYGPNSAIDASMANLVARSHALDRNNALANSARAQYVTNVVGRGMRPNLQLDNDSLRDEIMQLWERSRKEMDADSRVPFEGLQALAVSSMFESGDVLVKRIKRKPSSSLTVPMQLRVMESEMLVTGETTFNKRKLIKSGIELNNDGERVAYHLYRSHPNDAMGQHQQLETVRVNAEDMIHMFRPTRPGQLRGVPHLHAAMIRLYEMDKYMDAELQRKQQAAMHVGVIYNTSGNLMPQQVWSGTTGNDSDWIETRGQYYRAMGHMSAGTWNVLAPGDAIEFNEPKDVGDNHKAFIKTNLLEVAASAGISYEQLTGDMSEVNYSSARVRLIDLRRGFEMDQQHVLAFQFCQNVWEWWLDAAVMAGRVNIPNYFNERWKYMNVAWIADPFDYVDPATEFNVIAGQIQAGLASREEGAQARGRDTLSIDKENEVSQKREKQMDLFYTSNMRHTLEPQEMTGGTASNEQPPVSKGGKKDLQQTVGVDKKSGFK